MNNFRKNQPSKRRPSVDGMLPPQSGAGPVGRGNAMRPGANPLGGGATRNRLDDFRGPSGFRAGQQPLLRGSDGQALGRQPRRGPNGAIDLSLSPSPLKPKKRRSWKKIGLRSAAGIFVSLVVIVGFLFGKGYLKLHQIFKGGTEGAAALQDNVDPSKLRGEGDGRVNILLLGKGGAGHDGPDLTDTILIASIDPVQKQAALLSIPRDLWVTPDGFGSMKINAVYANAKYAALNRKASAKDAETAGFNAIEKEIQTDIGIPIHYHVMVDFAGFEQAVNTVGGVDINVDAANTVYEQLWDETTRKNYTLDVKQGPQHFDGQRALFYARSRHTSPRGDFDRTERQRKLLMALKDKVLSLGTFANPVKISQLLDAFGNHIQANMTIQEVMRLYDISKTLNGNSVASVGLADPPNNFVITANINGISIVRPRAGLTDFSEIQSYVRNTLKDGFIANENASIAVLNGTNTAGLATTKAAELKSYGYNVNNIADAPTKTYTKTILVDLTGGKKKYTKYYLEKRLGVTAVTSLPDPNIPNPGNSDFVIILGQ
ncbi:MAG TPA: LCP family protein [Candidatus Saccharimonadales bacterium]|nr:LCP family protein [Candidatus Saccharimonadales bacterium]